MRAGAEAHPLTFAVLSPAQMTQPEVLIQVLEILKNNCELDCVCFVELWLILRMRQQNKCFPVPPAAEFSEVESDFHAKVPAVFCREVCR